METPDGLQIVEATIKAAASMSPATVAAKDLAVAEGIKLLSNHRPARSELDAALEAFQPTVSRQAGRSRPNAYEVIDAYMTSLGRAGFVRRIAGPATQLDRLLTLPLAFGGRAVKMRGFDEKDHRLFRSAKYFEALKSPLDVIEGCIAAVFAGAAPQIGADGMAETLLGRKQATTRRNAITSADEDAAQCMKLVTDCLRDCLRAWDGSRAVDLLTFLEPVRETWITFLHHVPEARKILGSQTDFSIPPRTDVDIDLRLELNAQEIVIAAIRQSAGRQSTSDLFHSSVPDLLVRDAVIAARRLGLAIGRVEGSPFSARTAVAVPVGDTPGLGLEIGG